MLPEPERQPELAVRFTEIQLTSPQPEVSTPSGLASAPAGEPSQHQVKSAGGPEGPVQPHVSPAGDSKGPVQPSANAGGSVGLVQPSVPPSTPPDLSPSGQRPAPHGRRPRTSTARSVATFQAICGVIDSLLSSLTAVYLAADLRTRSVAAAFRAASLRSSFALDSCVVSRRVDLQNHLVLNFVP